MSRSKKLRSAPTITSVRDLEGEIAEGGNTHNTTVTVGGEAGGHPQVEVLDKAKILGTVTAATDHWTLVLSSLAFKAYSIKARAAHGEAESVVRHFSVIHSGENFEEGIVGALPANTPREFPAMSVTPIDKDASLIMNSDAAPIVTEKAVSFADDSSVRFVLKTPVNKVTYGAFAKASDFNVDIPYAAYFDEQGALILGRKLKFGADFAAWQEIVSNERKIKSLVITVNPGTDWLYVDNFTFA